MQRVAAAEENYVRYLENRLQECLITERRMLHHQNLLIRRLGRKRRHRELFGEFDDAKIGPAKLNVVSSRSLQVDDIVVPDFEWELDPLDLPKIASDREDLVGEQRSKNRNGSSENDSSTSDLKNRLQSFVSEEDATGDYSVDAGDDLGKLHASSEELEQSRIRHRGTASVSSIEALSSVNGNDIIDLDENTRVETPEELERESASKRRRVGQFLRRKCVHTCTRGTCAPNCDKDSEHDARMSKHRSCTRYCPGHKAIEAKYPGEIFVGRITVTAGRACQMLRKGKSSLYAHETNIKLHPGCTDACPVHRRMHGASKNRNSETPTVEREVVYTSSAASAAAVAGANAHLNTNNSTSSSQLGRINSTFDKNGNATHENDARLHDDMISEEECLRVD
ncbi:MAG: hypothetical protein MHM6MM_005992 [Cercozoa sp. M6MM]